MCIQISGNYFITYMRKTTNLVIFKAGKKFRSNIRNKRDLTSSSTRQLLQNNMGLTIYLEEGYVTFFRRRIFFSETTKIIFSYFPAKCRRTTDDGRSVVTIAHLTRVRWAKNEKRGVGCKKGGCCVLSTSTCDWTYTNFGGMVLGWSPSKIVSGDPDFQPRWPPS
jgi:hypothetical protein